MPAGLEFQHRPSFVPVCFRKMRPWDVLFFVLGQSLFLAKSYGFNITLLSYGVSFPSFLSGLPMTVPAYELGIKEIEKRYGYNISHVVLTKSDIVDCSTQISNTDMVSQYYYRQRNHQNFFAIITPACDEYPTLSSLSREWNVLLISSARTYSEMRDKEVHPTAVSVSAVQYNVYAQALFKFLEDHQWTTCALLYETGLKQPFYPQAADAVLDWRNDTNSPVTFLTYPVDTSVTNSFEDKLLQIRNSARVVILIFHPVVVRNIMVTAAKLQMVDQDYVYVTTESFRSIKRFGQLSWKKNDTNDEYARKGFRRLFQMSTCIVNVSNALLDMVREVQYAASPKNGVPNVTDILADGINLNVVAAYYAVLIFGQVLNESLSHGMNVHDAAQLARAFYNRTFSIADMGKVYIDDAGERQSSHCFLAMNRKTGAFEVIMYYSPVEQQIKITRAPQFEWDTADGRAPPNEPVCGYRNDKGPCVTDFEQTKVTALLGAFGGISVIVAFVVFAMFVLKKELYLHDKWWQIKLDSLTTAVSMRTGYSSAKTSDRGLFYKGKKVVVKNFPCRGKFHANRPALLALHEIRTISSANLVTLHGLEVTKTAITFVYESCEKGTFAEFLEISSFDWELYSSFGWDILEGIAVIHRSRFGRHGYLHPVTIHVTRHFTLKISELGLQDVLKWSGLTAVQSLSARFILEKQYQAWFPPEFYKATAGDTFSIADLGPEADIYTVGSFLHLLKRDCPTPQTDKEKRFVKTLTDLIDWCQYENPCERPSIKQATEAYGNGIKFARARLIHGMMRRLETYATQLESSVLSRTAALIQEQFNCDQLLAEILPPSLIGKLRKGIMIEPEAFHQASVYFSIVEGFASFTHENAPALVIKTLNDIFSVFDENLLQHNVYKVETIGDTYMVTSGIPEPNGDGHAEELCLLALQCRKAFLQSRSPGNLLGLAIGINSGPCAAGVVGKKRLRYCLFGDTVNTASRLASQGQGSKIQISDTTALLLKSGSTLYYLIPRGKILFKGKGSLSTYWLEEPGHPSRHFTL